MSTRKTPRKVETGFVGVKLTGSDGDPWLLRKLDAKVKETTTNRSHIIRQALIEYLK